jgi:hypothetical protein
MAKTLRTIITPVDVSLAVEESPLVFWKQILPEDSIVYEGRKITFDRQYHQDCIDEFKSRGSGAQTTFQLANPLNSHGRDLDPERQRGLTEDMALFEDLPPTVQEKIIAKEGTAKPGLYAKIRFFNKKAARSVRENPDLGVSPRVRENALDSKGNLVKRAVVHVLGTIDPRVQGMSPWLAVDLASSDSGVVIDLSTQTFKGEKKMAKGSTKVAKPRTLEELEDDVENAEEWTNEEITLYLQAHPDAADDSDDTDTDDDDDEDDDTDDEDDDDEDDEDVDTTSLSRKQKRRIDLANAQIADAQARANEALRRQADAEWKAERTDWAKKGVAPADLDLAEPVLNRPDTFVVDLSHEGGKKKSLDVSAIVRGLLESLAGTVDLSSESGHGSDNSDDPKKADEAAQEYADLWASAAPLPGYKG